MEPVDEPLVERQEGRWSWYTVEVGPGPTGELKWWFGFRRGYQRLAPKAETDRF